jgi:hypothetical protein
MIYQIKGIILRISESRMPRGFIDLKDSKSVVASENWVQEVYNDRGFFWWPC